MKCLFHHTIYMKINQSSFVHFFAPIESDMKGKLVNPWLVWLVMTALNTAVEPELFWSGTNCRGCPTSPALCAHTPTWAETQLANGNAPPPLPGIKKMNSCPNNKYLLKCTDHGLTRNQAWAICDPSHCWGRSVLTRCSVHNTRFGNTNGNPP